MKISARLMLSSSPGVIAAAALATFAAPALAQTQAPASSDNTIAEVVVTATRIDRPGFVAPTPTVVVNPEILQQRAAVNLAEVVNEIPSFRRTQAPESGGIANSGANNLDLRGLGPVRTLVLLDQSRLPATNLPGATVAGAIDLNLIPSAMVKRVDVVTGGASAAYGSDAVAGVVNLQIDSTLQGVKAEIQAGQTDYHDAADLFGAVAAGTSFAGGRGHFVIGGEYDHNDGTGLFNDRRAWGRENVTSLSFGTNRPAGIPASLIAPNVEFGMLTPGGLIAPTVATNPAALRNLQFVVGPNGNITTAPFNAGLYQGLVGTNMVGGTGTPPYQVLLGQTHRGSMAANVTYDLTDGVQLWGRALYSDVWNRNISAQIRAATGGTSGFLTILPTNPYLQAALTPAQLALVPAAGLQIGYLGNDFGPPIQITESKTYDLTGGLKGKFGDTWHWNMLLNYGDSQSVQNLSNAALSANFLNAINVVSVNGQNVCASAAAQAAGCQPINILGKASLSSAAYAYAFGTSHGAADTTLFETAANLNGEPFSLWAGPVSLGTGIEYRQETFLTNVDPLSQAGLFFARSPKNFPKVGDSVTEGYLETIVPLLTEKSLAGSLEFNGAVRETDYSISGAVTTWKTGLVWKPVEDIMVRGTVSRDIRAPSLPELYTPAVASVPAPLVSDPRAAFAASAPYTYTAITGGNKNLKPEVSNTDSVGVVLNPRFLKRLRFSVDYYNINITSAIGATSAGTIITDCVGTGVVNTASPYCALITFANNDPVAGKILSVVSNNANFANFKTSGFDYALSYSKPVSDFVNNVPGNMTFDLEATNALENRSTFDISLLYPQGVNRAGQTGAGFGGAAGLPNWLINATLAYRSSKFEAGVQYRWISPSHQNNAAVGPDQPGYSPTLVNSISDNNIPGVGYVNLNASYNFGTDRARRELYITVNNVSNTPPPLPAINNNAYYDILGRAYRVGFRFGF